MRERSVWSRGISDCSACRRAPQLSLGSLEGRFIAERIVQSRRDDTCFKGALRVAGLPCSLCPPLTLRKVSVTDIQTVCGGCNGERLRLELCCLVSDARGCRAEGSTSIEVDVRSGLGRGAVRRAAEIGIVHAQSCPPGCFEVHLSICIYAIVTRCELISGKDVCENRCGELPLYPQPPRLQSRTVCREHFFR